VKRDLHFDIVYPHPPERVWNALTDPAALGEWLMDNSFEPRLGHRFQFRTTPRPGFKGLVDCEVTELDPPRRLAYTWHGGWTGRPTVVTYTLEAVPEGTRQRLDHTGFRGISGIALSLLLGSGWKSNILRRSLPNTLERLARDDVVSAER
jgi:uncharacterized protein YndB with AHSA1/START domain